MLPKLLRTPHQLFEDRLFYNNDVTTMFEKCGVAIASYMTTGPAVTVLCCTPIGYQGRLAFLNVIVASCRVPGIR